MKNKTMDLIIKVSTLLFCYITMVRCEPIEVLFNHREYLKQWTEECRPSLSKEPLFLLFSEISIKELDYWKKNKDKIINVFIELCYRQVDRRFNSQPRWWYNYLDAVQTDILINILSDLPSEMDERTIRLLKRTPYPYLNNHQIMIVDILKKGNNIDRFNYLASVIDPPADIKKTLLASEKLSLGLKARLGDKKSEDELIQKVSDYTNGWNVSKLNDELFLCGTNECFKAVFKLFVKYKPPMNKDDDCTLMERPLQNQRIGFIVRFRMYHPELPLLHDDYDAFGWRGRKATWDMTVDYMERFVTWGNAEYGANVEIENWFLFDGQCEPLASRERMVREWKANSRHDSLMREHSGYRLHFSKTEREIDSLKLARRSKKLEKK